MSVKIGVSECVCVCVYACANGALCIHTYIVAMYTYKL